MFRRIPCAHARWLWALVAILRLVTPGQAVAAEPLHERIDQLLESGSLVPPAPLASDSDFVRRLYVDLIGRIPSAAEARAFLDDTATDKRRVLIDRLLLSAEHARHMAHMFDVALMERRPDKHVSTAEWRKYLFESFLQNKPYDQLVREILGADGIDSPLRPAAKFYLDREVETNVLVRDVGRMFFGVDLQCAQCHDHPLIDDYLQADYYGLFAFVNRSFLFTGKDQKVLLGEKAEGEAAFQSVFDPDQKGQTGPKLPDGSVIAEPTFAKGEEYLVAPADGVRPVPKFSRRTQLALVATDGKNRPFNLNIANRLWAQMMGRGLVEPVDLHHGDNPAVRPEVLELLATEIVSLNYDLQALLRELALTRTYQRSIDLPPDLPQHAGQLAANLPAYQAEAEQLKTAAEASRMALVKVEEEQEAAQKALRQLSEQLASAQAAEAAARKLAEEATATLATAQSAAAGKQDLARALAEATTKAQEALAKLPGDQELAKAVETIQTRSNSIAAELATVTASLNEQQAKATELGNALTAAQQAAAALAAQVETTRQQSQPSAAQLAEAKAKATADADRLRRAEERVREVTLLVEAFPSASPAPTESPEQEVALRGLTEQWNKRFAVTGLKPLSPEQLAWSIMQAVGLVDQQRAAAEAEWTRLGGSADETAKGRFVEQFIYERLSGNAGEFVRLFGGSPGQPQSGFHATVDQALFFANGPQVRGWLAPGGGNLSERLTQSSDPKAAAEELYLSILSRRPSPEEVADLEAYLAPRAADRAVAVQEAIWALLCSTEFRFNH